jgi:hypothetical protein
MSYERNPLGVGVKGVSEIVIEIAAVAIVA